MNNFAGSLSRHVLRMQGDDPLELNPGQLSPALAHAAPHPLP